MKVVLALPFRRERLSFDRIIPDEERHKWSTVSWPSNLADAFKRSMEMAKLKTKLTIDAFRATQLMLPRIPTPRIELFDEGSPIKRSYDLPNQSMIHPKNFSLI